MAVKFEFTLSDINAEVLFDTIQSAIVNELIKAGKAIVKDEMGEVEWHNARADLLQEIKSSMANTRATD